MEDIIKQWRRDWKCIKVTPATLLKKRKYLAIPKDQRWGAVIDDGWRFDYRLGKLYKLFRTGEGMS